jgi:hypothetical protein
MGAGNYIATILISFFYFLAVIPIVFDVPRFFVTVFLVLIGLILLAIIAAAAVYTESMGSWALFAIVYAAGLFYAIGLYFLTTHVFLFAIAVVLAVIGFLHAVMSAGWDGREKYEYDKYSEKVDKGVDEEEVIVEEIKPAKTVEKVKPDIKYVASATGSAYHDPSCVAAKRIDKKNAVWFKNKREASRRGYREHRCIK